MYSKSIIKLIQERISRRVYADQQISSEYYDTINSILEERTVGPFGSKLCFKLVAATEDYRTTLKNSGTYGLIKNPAGFVAGTLINTHYGLIDYGYVLEEIVLKLTELGLGTCWLGVSFRHSAFSEEIGVSPDEVVPAIVSFGFAADQYGSVERIVRWGVQSHKRFPWNKLFFDQVFDNPLTVDRAGQFATPLEMVRLGPSASNRQPWRIIKGDGCWHLYMQRFQYYAGLMKVLNRQDIQMLDMGVAMCHFEGTCKELGLQGVWEVERPSSGFPLPNRTEYVATFRCN